MIINSRVIIHLLGLLTAMNGGFMLLMLPFAFYYKEDWKSILLASGLAIALGAVIYYLTLNYKVKELRKREGYLIVTMGWLCMSFSGALPYLTSGAIPNFTDAFYETVSGYTTTGATILIDIEVLPKSILFWRSLTHWIGGMGIIVLTIAILPVLGIGGMQLFMAEAPGPTQDKLHPRIKETAKRLWYIYLSLTFIQMLLLMVGGMTFFDAINHAMST